MSRLASLYQAAAAAGLLPACRWVPPDGGSVQVHPVGFSAPDEALLDGLALGTDYAITYPAVCFVGLGRDQPVEIAGVAYVVREVRALGDGTERRATLTRV